MKCPRVLLVACVLGFSVAGLAQDGATRRSSGLAKPERSIQSGVRELARSPSTSAAPECRASPARFELVDMAVKNEDLIAILRDNSADEYVFLAADLSILEETIREWLRIRFGSPNGVVWQLDSGSMLVSVSTNPDRLLYLRGDQFVWLQEFDETGTGWWGTRCTDACTLAYLVCVAGCSTSPVNQAVCVSGCEAGRQACVIYCWNTFDVPVKGR